LAASIFCWSWLRGEQRNEVDQIAVVRHHLCVGVRPIGAPDHPVGSRPNDAPSERHRIQKGRASPGYALTPADLDPAFFVPPQQVNQRPERQLIEPVRGPYPSHMIDRVTHRKALERFRICGDFDGVEMQIDAPAERRDHLQHPLKYSLVRNAAEMSHEVEPAAPKPPSWSSRSPRSVILSSIFATAL
jgi:hypothetical protein